MASDSRRAESLATARQVHPVRTRERLSRLAPLLALLSVLTALLVVDLGGPWLWEDEADTALFARAIREHALPLAWDGRSFIDSDDGMRVAAQVFGRPLVMVGTPWLPYYVTAASFAALGESEFAARLPAALAGLATVALLYAVVLRETGCARAAFAAALLLCASTQFLLYAREARSQSLNMLLGLLVLFGFLRLGRRARDPWLVVGAVLLFHTQALPAALALGACAAVALLLPSQRDRLRPLLARAPLVAALTVPWLAISWSAAGANWTPVASFAQLGPRLAQLGAEASLAVPALGWLVGLPLVARRLTRGDGALVAWCAAWLALCAALVPLVLSESLLEVVGLRYVAGLLPVAAAVSGVLVARAAGPRPGRYALLLSVFAATHLAGNALPWLALGESRRLGSVSIPVPRELRGKLLNETWLAFARGLGRRDPGALEAIVGVLASRAAPDDVVVTNFGWDNLYFYSKLPLGMRIAPDAPIRRVARAHGLPDYVFEPDAADWIVWRGGNEAELGYPLTALGAFLPDLRRAFEARGARLEPVAALPETLWENRPELRWHRFPSLGQPFAPRRLGARGVPYRDVQILRVHWPRQDERPASEAGG